MISQFDTAGAAGDSASDLEPCYLRLHRSGELAERVKRARRHMKDCDLCARYCHVNRFQTLRGVICRTGERAVIRCQPMRLGQVILTRGEAPH